MCAMSDHIRINNGPEFIAKAIRDGLAKLGVKTLYIEPCSPFGKLASRGGFNIRLRDELLRVEQFANASHARAEATAWREDYNAYRSHCPLIGLPQAEFARLCAASAPAAQRQFIGTRYLAITLIIPGQKTGTRQGVLYHLHKCGYEFNTPQVCTRGISFQIRNVGIPEMRVFFDWKTPGHTRYRVRSKQGVAEQLERAVGC